ncbi:MAG: DUF1934 domain-containing protein [Pseudobutyrivibrio sp.]|nr:DUF1934 domain-containing protein [Pseudobutyrivibrio sp.]
MEKNQCKIHLQSRQKMGEDDETTNQEYLGEIAERDGRRYLSYQRSSEDGDISCLISFDRRKLSMTQKGALNSKLELMPGKKTENIYSTPMGDLNLAIFTREYQVTETSEGIKLILDYDIITGGEPIRTSMDIEIKF